MWYLWERCGGKGILCRIDNWDRTCVGGNESGVNSGVGSKVTPFCSSYGG